MTEQKEIDLVYGLEDHERKTYKSIKKDMEETMECIKKSPNIKILLFVTKAFTEACVKNIHHFARVNILAENNARKNGENVPPTFLYQNHILNSVIEHIQTGKCEKNMMQRYKDLKEHMFELDETFSTEGLKYITLDDSNKKVVNTREEAYRLASEENMHTLNFMKGHIDIAIAIRKKMQKFVK